MMEKQRYRNWDDVTERVEYRTSGCALEKKRQVRDGVRKEKADETYEW